MERNKRTIKLIRLYQKHKRISGRCHYIPSCSNYAIGCYEKFNWFKASILTGFRILRCHPFARRRVDLVPLTKLEKRKAKLLNSLKEHYDSCFIDTVLNQSIKYPKMESIDYVILTLEYLFGFSTNKTSSFNTIEPIGKNYVRCSYPKNTKVIIDEVVLDNYLAILEILSENKFISYSQPTFDINTIEHSKIYCDNYHTDYYVVKTKDLTLDDWSSEINKHLTDNTIIGMENANPKVLEYFKEKLKAEIIDIKDFKHHPTNNITIVTGDNLTKPKIAYHLNYLIKFFDSNEVFNINQYNLIIPK